MQQQLSEAFTIMLTGMVTVFVFLILLLVAMGILRRFTAIDESEAVAPSSRAPSPKMDKQLLAAITAAVHNYRRHHK
jgi:oxaloacetate decarboxylase gamma subunit